MGLLRIKPILQTSERTLRGRVPSLSIEITCECPLRCPGCYAYETLISELRTCEVSPISRDRN